MEKIEIELYTSSSGKSPFTKWITSLGVATRAIMHRRIARIEAGNFGDSKLVKGTRGLHELRIHEGPGYRIYFGKRKNIVVVLLCGGKKGTQRQDIEKAKDYWQDYLENNEG